MTARMVRPVALGWGFATALLAGTIMTGAGAGGVFVAAETVPEPGTLPLAGLAIAIVCLNVLRKFRVIQ